MNVRQLSETSLTARCVRDAILISSVPTFESLLFSGRAISFRGVFNPAIFGVFTLLWIVLGFGVGCYFCCAAKFKYLFVTSLIFLLFRNLPLLMVPKALLYVFWWKLSAVVAYALLGWGLAYIAERMVPEVPDRALIQLRVFRLILCGLAGAILGVHVLFPPSILSALFIVAFLLMLIWGMRFRKQSGSQGFDLTICAVGGLVGSIGTGLLFFGILTQMHGLFG